MCGIFGAVSINRETVRIDGKKVTRPVPWDSSIIKGLAWANRERGTDSLGFFDSSGRMVKRAADPSDALQDDKVRRWINNSREHTWAIGGHTRYATQGGVNKANAHPFKYGHIIGSHNGLVQSPAKYTVDSEYLFDVIREHGYKGLEAVRGYWGLSWYDLNEQCFYLTKHNGSVSYGVYNGVLYYSSSDKHLASMIEAEIKDLKEGQVLKFTADGNILDSEEKHIEGVKAGGDYWDWEGWEGGRYGAGYYGTGCTPNYPKTGRGASRKVTDSGTTKSTDGTLVRTYTSYDKGTTGTAQGTSGNLLDDWDGETKDEWNEAWDKYFHSMTDEEFKTWDAMA